VEDERGGEEEKKEGGGTVKPQGYKETFAPDHNF